MVYQRKVAWDDKAKAGFREQIRYIREDSVQNAEHVRKDILKKVKDILKIRKVSHLTSIKLIIRTIIIGRFELHRLRISYFVGDTEIRIVRVRHTSQKPSHY